MIALMFATLGCGNAPTTPVEPVASEAPTQEHFGAPFSVEQALPASTVLGNPAAHEGAPVRLVGELTQVCQKMGCWAVVRDDEGRTMRVTMKDHAFGIAKDTVGKSCDVEGQLVSKDVDPSTLEHYASEGGGEHPEAGQAKAWQLVATTVAVTR